MSDHATATWTADDVRRATDRFAAALAEADPAAVVPSCPGWTVLELVTHIGNVYSWTAAILAAGEQAPRPKDEATPDDLVGWYAARAERLVDAVAASDPAAPCWNFAGVHETAAFWARRQVHETGMHLVDLEQARGRLPEIDAATATDGITETLQVFLPRLHAAGVPLELDRPVSLVATDTGRTWTLSPVPDAPPALTVGDGTGTLADDRLEGDAAAVWLLLWKRADEGVERTGDADRLARFVGSRLTS